MGSEAGHTWTNGPQVGYSILNVPDMTCFAYICSIFKYYRSEMESCEDQTKQRSTTTVPFSKVEMQVTMNLFIIFVAYILCLTPQAICNVVTCPIDENVTRYIVLLNSVINPFIYGVKHPLFRSIFICIIRCRKVPEPSTFVTSTIRILQRT